MYLFLLNDQAGRNFPQQSKLPKITPSHHVSDFLLCGADAVIGANLSRLRRPGAVVVRFSLISNRRAAFRELRRAR
jgi:hypothetical protein